MSQIGPVRATIVVLTLAIAFLLGASRGVRGERVGYSFTGNFIPISSGMGTPATEYNVFGAHFPLTAPFRGTFSYDTSRPGIVPTGYGSNTKAFKQFIEGGFTFDVLQADELTPIFGLSANVYNIQVTNDYTPMGAPVASDLFSAEVNPLSDPTLPPILKDDVPYPSTPRKPVYVSAPVSWDSTMFSDPDEPKLHADLPEDGTFPFQGSMAGNGVAWFMISSFSRITPQPGDYNIDGRVSQKDFSSWRGAYGQTSSDYSYADGNHDGIVDGADYVIWRSALYASAGGTASSSIPEPSTTVLAALSLLSLGGLRRRHTLW